MDEVAWLAAHMPIPGPPHTLYRVLDNLPDLNHGAQLDVEASRCVVLEAAVAHGSRSEEPPRIFRDAPSATLRERLPPAALDVLRKWPGKFMVAGGCPLAAAAARDIPYGDIDIFPCGADVATADAALEFLCSLCESLGGTFSATARAVTFTGMRGHDCPVQLVTQIASSPACVLNNFDLDACRVGALVRDGEVTMVATGAWFAAMRARAFPVVSWQWSKISPCRIAKYALKGFAPVIPGFDRARAESNTERLILRNISNSKYILKAVEARNWGTVATRLRDRGGLLLILVEVAISRAFEAGEPVMAAVVAIAGMQGVGLGGPGVQDPPAEGEDGDALAGLRWRDMAGRSLAAAGGAEGDDGDPPGLDYYASLLNRVIPMRREMFIVDGDSVRDPALVPAPADEATPTHAEVLDDSEAEGADQDEGAWGVPDSDAEAAVQDEYALGMLDDPEGPGYNVAELASGDDVEPGGSGDEGSGDGAAVASSGDEAAGSGAEAEPGGSGGEGGGPA